MTENFWEKLPKPIFALAPMADVTDTAFRRLIAKYGKPDVTWTEFVSADGLEHPEARSKLLIDLEYTEAERPIVAQLFSSNPDNMRKAAALCASLGFDGIDINMGCPDRSVEKQGSGAAMIKDPENARAVIRAAKEGSVYSTDQGEERRLPVSVKTRVGYRSNDLDVWLPELLAEEPAVVTIHARTRGEMSKVPADWERIRQAVEIRDSLGSSSLILGNGDLVNLSDAKDRVAATGADGAMLGKAIFGNPWLFSQVNENRYDEVKPRHSGAVEESVWRNGPNNGPVMDTESQYVPSVEEKLRVAVEHTETFEKLLGNTKSFHVMKKHFKAYVSGFDGARELRAELMDTNNADEVKQIIDSYLSTLNS